MARVFTYATANTPSRGAAPAECLRARSLRFEIRHETLPWQTCASAPIDQYVVATGERCGWIDKAAIVGLLDQLEAIDITNMHHVCTLSEDIPATWIALRTASGEFSYHDAHMISRTDTLDHAILHRRFRGLGRAIDAACNIEQWAGSAAERTARFPSRRP